MISDKNEIDNEIELYYLMKKGDAKAKKAFAELYAKYSNRVYSYCLRYLSDRELARDVFQDTFSRFYESAKSSRPMNNVPGFLLRIARNLCVNQYRVKKTNVELTDNISSTNDYGYDNSELLDLIHKALDELSPEIKEAFILKEYEGFTYQEVADMLETNVSNVKVKIFRAKEKIRQILSPYLKDINKNT